MIKLIFLLFQIVVKATDLVSFAAKFNIKLNKDCPSVNLGLKVIENITTDCDWTDTSKLFGCIEKSVTYLKEITFKLQKCLDRDSYYEFGNLISYLEEDQFCSIFQTTSILNDYLKTSNSLQTAKAIIINSNVINNFEASCKIDSFKFGKKVADFMLTFQKQIKIYKIVKNWAEFFNNLEMSNSDTLSNSLENINEKDQEKINSKNNNVEKNQEKKNDEPKNTNANSSIKLYSFLEELYCAFKKILEILDSIDYYVGKNPFTRVYRDFINNCIDKFYIKENLAAYDCSYYEYDLYSLFWRFWFILFGANVKNVQLIDLKWAFGIINNLELENKWKKFNINGIPDLGLNMGFFSSYLEKGIKYVLKKYFDKMIKL